MPRTFSASAAFRTEWSIGRPPTKSLFLFFEGFFLGQAMPSSVLADTVCPRTGPADDLAGVVALLAGRRWR